MATGKRELGWRSARKQVAFVLSTDCARNRRQSSSGEQLLLMLKPRQEGQEVLTRIRVSNAALQAGKGDRAWQPSSSLADWQKDAVVPGLAVQVADTNLGQFRCIFLMASKSNW